MEQIGNDFERSVEALAYQVGLFHEVSNVVRKASRQACKDLVPTSFKILDQEGNDFEDVLKTFFIHNLQDQFPKSSPNIRERLATTMIIRRRKILYRRIHYSATPIKPFQPVQRPISIQRRASTKSPEITRDEEESQKSPQRDELGLEVSQAQSMVKSPTMFDTENFENSSTPSIVSSINYANANGSEELAFPPPIPVSASHPDEPTCPFCLYVLPSIEFGDVSRWKTHVLADSRPLVCLFDPCDEPGVLYSHRKDWLRHMRRHTKHWRCTARTHGLQNFESFENFLRHMKIDHKRSYIESQKALLAERGVPSTGHLFETCPLCGLAEKGNGTDSDMVDHIIFHLRSLALKSLPPPQLYEEDPIMKAWISRHSEQESLKDTLMREDDATSVAPCENTSSLPYVSDPDRKPSPRAEDALLDSTPTPKSFAQDTISLQSTGLHYIASDEDGEKVKASSAINTELNQQWHKQAEFRRSLHAMIQPRLPPLLQAAPPATAVVANQQVQTKMPGSRRRILLEAASRRPLNEYKVFIFKLDQGLQEGNNRESVGRPRSDWENATKSFSRGTSIEWDRLTMQGQDIEQQKLLLPPSLLRRLDHELHQLQGSESEISNFTWTLVHTEYQSREANRNRIPPPRANRSASTTVRPLSSVHGKVTSREYVSFAAYFKRSARQSRSSGKERQGIAQGGRLDYRGKGEAASGDSGG